MKFIINYLFFTGLISMGWCAMDFILNGDEIIKLGKLRMPEASENKIRAYMLAGSFLIGWYAVPKVVFRVLFR